MNGHLYKVYSAAHARADHNLAFRWAAERGHVDVLRFLDERFGINAQTVA